MSGGLSRQQAWWVRYTGATYGPVRDSQDTAPPFPQSPLPLAVDLFMFGNWVPVPGELVLQRDRIGITRGQPGEGSVTDPTRIRLSLNNRDGRFSPRNPTGIWYGQIGRNTRLRVRVGNDVRGVGAVTAWPPRWDITGNDVWVPVQADGILRQLQQGSTPLRSPMYRWVTSATALLLSLAGTADPPVAYWPCEDGSDSTQIASALGGPAMTVVGTPTFASSSDFTSSDPVPVVANSRWTGAVPDYTSTGTIHVACLISVPAAGATNGAILLRLRCDGTAPQWDVRYNTGGSLTVLAYDRTGSNVLTSGPHAFGLNGVPMLLELQLEPSGSDINMNLSYEPLGPTEGGTGGATLSSATVGRATTITVDPTSNLDQIAIGHIIVWAQTVFSESDALDGYLGETAGTRIRRLCTEEGIAYVRVPPSNGSTPMGVQRSGKLLDLLRECEAADGGILFETRADFGLSYIDRQALYNQDPALTLDYAAADLSQIEPTDDDQTVRNDVTVSRTGGSSSRQVLEQGALSIQDPPDGVGRYDTAVTINIETDATLGDQARWRLHLATVDEQRVPQLGLNLARANYTADATARTKADTAAALDVGNRLVVTNPPAWLPPDQISQLTIGFTETLNTFERTITANCVPASAYEVGVYDDAAAFYSPDGSELAQDYDASATSLLVSTPDGPLWTHDDGDFDVLISGERCTVTNVTGSSSPQTFTVTRAVNGISKTLPAGAEVALAQPAIYAL